MGPDIQTRRVQLRDRFASWTPCTLHERLDKCAAAYGDRPFVITDDRTISYAETAQWSRRLADGLAVLGRAARGPGRHAGGQLLGVHSAEVRDRPDRGGWSWKPLSGCAMSTWPGCSTIGRLVA